MTPKPNTDVMPDEEQLIVGAVSRAAERMPSRSRRDVRRRVMSVAGGAPLRAQRLAFTRAAAAFTVTASLLSGVSVAAAASLPGDMLYGLKRSAEDVAIAVLPNGAVEQDLLFSLATRRGEEADRLLARGANQDEVDIAISQFRLAVSRAYGVSGVQSDLGDVTAAQTRLVDRVRTMAASVQATYEAAVREQQGGSGGSGSVGSGTSSGSEGSDTPSISGSGGSGSSGGSSPSEGSQSGSGGPSGGSGSDSGSAPRSSSDTGAPQGSRETTGGLKEGRKP